ncbi:hypothetical protein ACFOGJ_22115 [Marinibaculum pumilum]|uniref:Uncharacterized protein n=1 Tax=Marinibaculum pumilum TaxID=1766165 RepID=A0ABV7L6I2_9PROT
MLLPALLLLGACTAHGGGVGPGGGSPGSGNPGPTGESAVRTAPALHSGDLVGWSGSDLQGRFGPPMLTFAEPPAEVWRYSSARCVALFFLYPPDMGNDGQAVVRYVELLPREAVDSDCLQAIGEQGTV